jgi:hypothetical protein
MIQCSGAALVRSLFDSLSVATHGPITWEPFLAVVHIATQPVDNSPSVSLWYRALLGPSSRCGERSI